MMQKIILISLSILLFSSLLYWGSGQTKKGTNSNKDLISRGEYLVTLGGCNDCHTPKIFTEKGMELDTKRIMSGHPAHIDIPTLDPQMLGPGKWLLFNDHLTASVGPWGLTYAANLTPDEQTGIGLWKEENFIQAMRTGKHMGAGRPIMPPMPWENLSRVTDEDLTAMFAYLKSLPAIKNRVPAPIPAAELFE